MAAEVASPMQLEEDELAAILAAEAEELDGYFSDAPLDPEPYYPDLRESMETSVVICNLPVVPEEKVDRLNKYLTKLVSKVGPLAARDDFSGIHMPFDQVKGTTKGFCYIEYQTASDATKVVAALQGYQFDKNHNLQVMHYPRARELEKSASSEAGYKAPAQTAFEEKPNALSWLQDTNQRDEFALRFGSETEIFWWDGGKSETPELDYDGARQKEAGVPWCEYYCHWSPAGSYLATLLPNRGVVLWSGENYEKVGRFVAPGVKMVVFSPQENYILTNNENMNDEAAIKVYHIPTGNLLRTFGLYPDGFLDNVKKDQQQPPPPPFLWSHDDQYLARMGQGLISIFVTPAMRLLDQRSLATEGICEFQWSPADNVLAYWVCMTTMIH